MEVDYNRMKKTKIVQKLSDAKNHSSTAAALRFLKHIIEEGPKILWRIATFSSSAKDIREEIILPLAEILENLKKEGLTLQEKEYNTFKLILFWPELILKIPGSLRKAAASFGVTAATKAPQFYKASKQGKLHLDKNQILASIKTELGLDRLQAALSLHSKPLKRKRR